MSSIGFGEQRATPDQFARVARTEYVGIPRGADMDYQAREFPATDEERRIAIKAAKAWVEGTIDKRRILVVEDRGERAGSKRVLAVTERVVENGKVKWNRKGERPVEMRDIQLIKVVRQNQHGLDFDPETLEPYKSRIRICLCEGSRVEIACDLPPAVKR